MLRDFFYRRTSGNVTRLLAALQDFGAPPVTRDRSHLEMSDAVTAFGEPPMRIDLLSDICGVSFDAAQLESKDLDDLAHLSSDTPR